MTDTNMRGTLELEMEVYRLDNHCHVSDQLSHLIFVISISIYTEGRKADLAAGSNSDWKQRREEK